MRNINIFDHPYTYIVLEHATALTDARIHGQFTTRESALGLKNKLETKGILDPTPDNTKNRYIAKGYVAIVKQHIQGRKPKVDVEKVNWEYCIVRFTEAQKPKTVKTPQPVTENT